MTLSMHPNEWLTFLRQEYLNTFIREGGAATKFCVPLDDNARETLLTGIKKQSSENDYLFTEINSAETRVDSIEHIFFRIAEQIDWEQLAKCVLRTVCKDSGYELPIDADGLSYQSIAKRNQTEPSAVFVLLRKQLTNHVFRRPELAKDFRVAMLHLCQAELSAGQDSRETKRILGDWLTGRNRNVSAVKPYSIFNRITRSSARHLIESLFQWVRIAGHSGLVVAIDLARLAVVKNPKDDLLFYTTRALLDTYEVLREFIDSMDRLAGSLLVVVPDSTFLDEDNTGRGLGRYEALKFRIYDEVRAKQLVNPMASLIRLSTAEGD